MSYYRLEYPNGMGVLASSRGIIDEDLLRPLRNGMAEPRYIKKNPDAITRSWFTEAGYEKFESQIFQILDYSVYYEKGIRLIKATHLDNLVSKGKIQVLQFIKWKEKEKEQ